MTHDLEQLIKDWDGQAVLSHFDAPSGTWIFVAIHDLSLGAGCGGCRMKVYPTPAEGLRDAMRLARGMTHKWAAIDFDFGGGKTVLAVPRPLEGEEREGVFRRLGRVLNTLNGSYSTGQDLGTTPEDMQILSEETKWVHTGDEAHGGKVDPGPYTALGVLTCLRTVARMLWGNDDLEGRRILIQGVGGVGLPLVKHLVDAKADVILSDINASRVEAVAQELGARTVPNNAVPDTDCDILSPCAIGGTLNKETIARLRCRAVAGSANNQLEEDADADRLHERGILYAPDYVVNAGGAIAFGMMARGMGGEEAIRDRIWAIGTSLEEILFEAGERNQSPLKAAARKVEEVLARHGSPHAAVSAGDAS